MALDDSTNRRILVVHPDAATRDAVTAVLRRLEDPAPAVYEARSSSEALTTADRLDPVAVLLDLSEERTLSLDVAAALTRQGRYVVGLYSPLLVRGGEADFFRQASRAGVADFVPLPAAEAELAAALAGADERIVAAKAPEGRIVTFFSHKGGVGKTTLASNTAMVLAGSGAVQGGVALCDAAIRYGDAAAHFGLAPKRDLVDLVRDLDRPEALTSYLTHDEGSGLYILASPRDALKAETIEPEHLARVLIALRRRFEIVVVDTPPQLDLMTLTALDLSETIYVVTEAVSPTIVATGRFLELLSAEGFEDDRLRVVVNRYADFSGNLQADAVTSALGRDVEWIVPYDESVIAGVNSGRPLAITDPDSKFATAVGEIAEEIVGRVEVLA